MGPTIAKCLCPSPYTGYICEYENPCQSRPCKNDGLCIPINLFNSFPQYKCSCMPGFFGNNCEKNNLYDCSVNTCQNGGTCFKTPNGSIKCQCLPYFTGKNCESTNNPCSSSPCYNSGKCLVNYSRHPYYQCICYNGYYGNKCEYSELTTTTKKYVDNQNCIDTNPDLCKYYADNKYCSNLYLLNGIGILDYCPKSCNYCSPNSDKISCQDSQTNCAIFALYKQCSRLNYLTPHPCRKSCNLCK